MLEQVMDTETYKVAKEILEIYAPEQIRKTSMVLNMLPFCYVWIYFHVIDLIFQLVQVHIMALDLLLFFILQTIKSPLVTPLSSSTQRMTIPSSSWNSHCFVAEVDYIKIV